MKRLEFLMLKRVQTDRFSKEKRGVLLRCCVGWKCDTPKRWCGWSEASARIISDWCLSYQTLIKKKKRNGSSDLLRTREVLFFTSHSPHDSTLPCFESTNIFPSVQQLNINDISNYWERRTTQKWQKVLLIRRLWFMALFTCKDGCGNKKAIFKLQSWVYGQNGRDVGLFSMTRQFIGSRTTL